MSLFRLWVVTCDFAGCDARKEIGAFMREPEARWEARDHGWTGSWSGPWNCPAHHVAGESRSIPALLGRHEPWCPAESRSGPCACRAARLPAVDEDAYWARSDMQSWPRPVSNIRLPRSEGDEDAATGPPVPKSGRTLPGS